MKQRIGDKIVLRLKHFATALKQGDKLDGRFKIHTIEVPVWNPDTNITVSSESRRKHKRVPPTRTR